MVTRIKSVLSVTILLLGAQAFADGQIIIKPAPRPHAQPRPPDAPSPPPQQQQQQQVIIIEREPRRPDDDERYERRPPRRYNPEGDYMCDDECREPTLPYPPQRRLVPVYPPQYGPEYFPQPPPQVFIGPDLPPPVFFRPRHPGWGGHHPGPGPGWIHHGRRIALRECRVEEKPAGVFQVKSPDEVTLFHALDVEGAANAKYMLHFYSQSSVCTDGVLQPAPATDSDI